MQLEGSWESFLEKSLANLDRKHLRRRKCVTTHLPGAMVERDGQQLVNFGGNDYLVSSTGGAANPGMALDTATMGFAGDLGISTGNGCTVATCSGAVQGFLAGAGASHAGARFTFQTAPGRGQPTAAGVVTFVKRP